MYTRLSMIGVFGLAVFQLGLGFWSALCAMDFSHAPLVPASISMVYVMVSQVLCLSAVVSIKLAILVGWHEKRLRQLEQHTAESNPAWQAPEAPA